MDSEDVLYWLSYAKKHCTDREGKQAIDEVTEIYKRSAPQLIQVQDTLVTQLVGFEYFRVYCPSCKNVVHSDLYELGNKKDRLYKVWRGQVNYCDNCGQALDWSEWQYLKDDENG